MVRFSARNCHASTASTLRIAGKPGNGEAPVGESQANLDHLPPDSVPRGGLIFPNDPSRYERGLHPKRHVEPRHGQQGIFAVAGLALNLLHVIGQRAIVD